LNYDENREDENGFVYGENCKTIIDYYTRYLVVSTEYKQVFIG